MNFGFDGFVAQGEYDTVSDQRRTTGTQSQSSAGASQFGYGGRPYGDQQFVNHRPPLRPVALPGDFNSGLSAHASGPRDPFHTPSGAVQDSTGLQWQPTMRPQYPAGWQQDAMTAYGQLPISAAPDHGHSTYTEPGQPGLLMPGGSYGPLSDQTVRIHSDGTSPELQRRQDAVPFARQPVTSGTSQGNSRKKRRIGRCSNCVETGQESDCDLYRKKPPCKQCVDTGKERSCEKQSVVKSRALQRAWLGGRARPSNSTS